MAEIALGLGFVGFLGGLAFCMVRAIQAEAALTRECLRLHKEDVIVQLGVRFEKAFSVITGIRDESVIGRVETFKAIEAAQKEICLHIQDSAPSLKPVLEGMVDMSVGFAKIQKPILSQLELLNRSMGHADSPANGNVRDAQSADLSFDEIFGRVSESQSQFNAMVMEEMERRGTSWTDASHAIKSRLAHRSNQ